MINNVSFNGHARIDTEKCSDKEQIKLYKAINDPENKAEIKEVLPDDVEIKFSKKQGSHGRFEAGSFSHTIYSYFVAEFFKGEKKIGDATSKVEDPKNSNFVKDFVSTSITNCAAAVNDNKKAENNQTILEQLKSNNGLVV